MPEVLPVDLACGLTGEATYDKTNHQWTFSQTPGLSRELKIISGQTSESHTSAAHAVSPNQQNVFSRTQNLRKLVTTTPELTPAAASLPVWAEQSEFREELHSRYDHLRSELLAFGEVPVVSADTSRPEKVPVAATVAGISQDTIRLIRLNRERLSWQGNRSFHLDTTTFQDGVEAFWTGCAGPIQQLCFAQRCENKRTWLAIRYHTTIDIIQLHVTSKGALLSPGLRFSSSSDHSRSNGPNTAILSLPISQTGGDPQVDISFSPRISRRFAVVDQEGRWSVWMIEAHSQRKGSWHITQVANGRLDDAIPIQWETHGAFEDGWGRILWIGDRDAMVVVSRRLFVVVFIDERAERLQLPDLGLAQIGELILDIKSSSSSRQQVFLLTSTRVLWLQFQNQSQRNHDTTEPFLSARLLLSRKHYRDPTDRTLMLSIADHAEGSHLLLYSSFTGISTFSALGAPSSSPNTAIATYEPCNFPMRTFLDPLRQGIESGLTAPVAGCSTILLNSILPTKSKKTGAWSTPRRLSENQHETHYTKLSSLTNDLVASEITLAWSSNSQSYNIGEPRKRRLLGVPGPFGEETMDSFIVRDDAVGVSTNFLAPSRVPHSTHERIQISEHAADDPWTLPVEWVRAEIQEVSEQEPIPFSEALESLSLKLEQEVVDVLPSPKSLFELLAVECAISDIDLATDAFVDFLHRACKTIPTDDQEEPETEPCVGTMIINSLRENIGISEELVPLRVYDDLIPSWVATLSRHSSSRGRIMTERRARSIAGQICLAAYEYPFDSLEVGEQAGHEELGVQSELAFRPRRRSSASQTGFKGKGKAREVPSLPMVAPKENRVVSITERAPSSGQTLPTPEPTPSLHSQNSSASRDEVEHLASQHMKSFTNRQFHEYSQGAASAILDHWTSNPILRDYDWERTKESMATRMGLETDDEVSRSRDTERPGRPRKRRREGVSSQPTPTVVQSSQPQSGLDIDLQGSSMSTQPQIMSQPEPGLHGNRNRTIAKKKRRAGF